jgi:hypothetical protein
MATLQKPEGAPLKLRLGGFLMFIRHRLHAQSKLAFARAMGIEAIPGVP